MIPRHPNLKKIWNAYRFIREIRQRPAHKDYHWAHQLPLEWPTYRQFESYILANVGLPPTLDHMLCRVDRSQGWIADNLEWRTHRELARTLDHVQLRTYRKRTKMVTEWSEACGINYATVLGRINRGWPIQLALTIPVDKRFSWRERQAQRQEIK